MTAAFAEFWLSVLIQCTLLLGIAVWLTRRERSAAVRDGLWSAAWTTILILWLCGFLLPHLRLFSVPVWVSRLAESPSATMVQLLVQAVLRIWLLGVCLMGLGVAVSLWNTHRIVSMARSVDDEFGDIHPEFRRQRIEVRVSGMMRLPFCWQLHRPVIVLPESVLSGPRTELRAILCHELGHLISRHPLQLFLQRMVEVLFWFHPLVWFCSRTAALHREFVADAFAARNNEEAGALLQGLLQLSRVPRGESLFSSGLSLGGHGTSLRRRVDELLRRLNEPSETQRTVASVTMISVLAGSCLALIWLPVNPSASERSALSPWPRLSAIALKELGFSVRDFEVDNHRASGRQEHLSSRHLSGNSLGSSDAGM